MKFSLLTILSLFILIGCQSSKKHIEGVKKISDLEEMDLKGNIKTLRLKKYKATKNTRTGKIRKLGVSKAMGGENSLYTFDKNGNITQLIHYGINGEEKSKVTYKYDENNKEIIEKVFRSASEDLAFKRVDKYDESGNRIEHLSYAQGEDETPYKETFVYNENGNILEEIKYKSSGQLKTLYKYDDKELLTEMKSLKGDDLMMKETFEYDGDGKLISSTQEENRTVHAKYVLEKKYKNGKETERKSLKNGEPNGRYTYKYNKQGNRVEYQKYDLNNKLVVGGKTSFEYDDKNNWISKAPLNSRGIPHYLLEREIEYFND